MYRHVLTDQEWNGLQTIQSLAERRTLGSRRFPNWTICTRETPIRSPRPLRLPTMANMEKLAYTVDTSREALEVQLACLRQMSPRDRIRQTLAMSQRVRNMALNAIRRRHPELDEAEIGLLFIELTYGKSLADEIRRWQSERVS